jgi:hypothetical protein
MEGAVIEQMGKRPRDGTKTRKRTPVRAKERGTAREMVKERGKSEER